MTELRRVLVTGHQGILGAPIVQFLQKRLGEFNVTAAWAQSTDAIEELLAQSEGPIDSVIYLSRMWNMYDKHAVVSEHVEDILEEEISAPLLLARACNTHFTYVYNFTAGDSNSWSLVGLFRQALVKQLQAHGTKDRSLCIHVENVVLGGWNQHCFLQQAHKYNPSKSPSIVVFADIFLPQLFEALSTRVTGHHDAHHTSVEPLMGAINGSLRAPSGAGDAAKCEECQECSPHFSAPKEEVADALDRIRAERSKCRGLAVLLHIGSADVSIVRELATNVAEYAKYIQTHVFVVFIDTPDVRRMMMTELFRFGNAQVVSFRVVENRGMDIGGQLVNTLEVLKRDTTYKYVVFLHTKTKAHWRKSMLASIARHLKILKSTAETQGPRAQQVSKSMFGFLQRAIEVDGMNLSTLESLLTTLRMDGFYKFTRAVKSLLARASDNHFTNLEIHQELLRIRPHTLFEHSRTFAFVPGTMFVFDGPRYITFWRERVNELHQVLDLLEKGRSSDVDAPTFTHAMERVFGAIAEFVEP